MSKQKTRKSAVKRFKVTKSGKILRRAHGGRHLKSNKSKKQLRHLKHLREVKGLQKVKVKRMLGI